MRKHFVFERAVCLFSRLYVYLFYAQKVNIQLKNNFWCIYK